MGTRVNWDGSRLGGGLQSGLQNFIAAQGVIGPVPCDRVGRRVSNTAPWATALMLMSVPADATLALRFTRVPKDQATFSPVSHLPVLPVGCAFCLRPHLAWDSSGQTPWR